MQVGIHPSAVPLPWQTIVFLLFKIYPGKYYIFEMKQVLNYIKKRSTSFTTHATSNPRSLLFTFVLSLPNLTLVS